MSKIQGRPGRRFSCGLTATVGYMSSNFVPSVASQAARTELRNLPTSRLSRLLSPDSDFAAVST